MELVYLLLLHFVADFLLQNREMGQKKSEDFKWLFYHISIQFIIFAVGGFLVFENPFPFAILNALVHGLIDWNIWKLYKMSVYVRTTEEREEHKGSLEDWMKHLKSTWKYWEDHWFYATIGFDQLLHTITIVLLYGWLV